MQYMKDKSQKSRMWRLAVKDGKVDQMVLVAKGFNVANGTAVHGDHVYITESVLEEGYNPTMKSEVLRFKLDEENVTLKTPLKDDPHVITTFKSRKKEWPFGADGIAFDSKGNLFVGLFSDGILFKIEFDAKGDVKSNKLFVQAPFMKTCDGMSCDLHNDKLYVPDSASNSINVVSPDGSVATFSQNGEFKDKKPAAFSTVRDPGPRQDAGGFQHELAVPQLRGHHVGDAGDLVGDLASGRRTRPCQEAALAGAETPAAAVSADTGCAEKVSQNPRVGWSSVRQAWRMP